MKTQILHIIFLFVTSIVVGQNKGCSSKTNITKFINEFFIAENIKLDLNNIPEYIFFNKAEYEKLSTEKKKIFSDYLKILIDLEHKELKMCSYQYKLKRHVEVAENLLRNYRLNFEDKSNVYYLVCNDRIITHFILNHECKIISFAPNVSITHGGRIEPYMLDKIE